MVNFYIRDNCQKVVGCAELERLSDFEYKDIAWIDMLMSDDAERKAVEQYLDINLQTRQRAQEIESSSRYYEDENALYANTAFVTFTDEGMLEAQQVSFALCEGVLVSMRPLGLRAFNDTARKLYINSRQFPTCFHIIVSILESRIDIDADMLELLAKELSTLKAASMPDSSSRLDRNFLLDINRLQENTMTMRESIVDKQRIISSFLKSDNFPSDTMPKLNIMIKDIGSLISYADFMFDRLEYLQNTVLGLISLEQNKVIKVFTVATLIFMPPTLIGTIYGMNFSQMPELTWAHGYPYAIGLMFVSIIGTLLFFKIKKLL